jgi:alanine racemase
MTDTIAEINLNNLVYNINQIRKKVFPSLIIPVVKADAYGHGAIAVTKCLAKQGVKLFAVARFKEAMELRDSGISEPILIFGRLFPEQIPEAINADFRISLFCKQDIAWIQKADFKKQAKVHVNLETGMGRIGALIEQEPDFFDVLTESDCIWEGLYSHFSTSDCHDKTFANIQLSKFKRFLSQMQGKKKQPFVVHMANSGAVLDIKESFFNAVRPGIIMYGYYPSFETSESVEIKQVMTFKTFVSHIRKMPVGHPVSYGRRWITKKPTKIAVLPVGYADGVRRDLTNNGQVIIRCKIYKMVGTVTMDHIMINIGDDPVSIGDEAILWGDSDQGAIQLLEIATRINTIPYELTCGVSKRVKRFYTY